MARISAQKAQLITVSECLQPEQHEPFVAWASPGFGVSVIRISLPQQLGICWSDGIVLTIPHATHL